MKPRSPEETVGMVVLFVITLIAGVVIGLAIRIFTQ